jgi:hypothetical protein
VLDWLLNRKWFGGILVFGPSTGQNAPVSLMGVIIVKFTHAIARVLKGIKVWAGRGATFGAGLPLLLLPLFLLLGAGLPLRCVEAAATVGSWPPQAFTMAAAISWVPAPTASLLDGGRWTKYIEKKKIIVR